MKTKDLILGIILILFIAFEPISGHGFTAANKAISNELTYIHTDRDVYIAGETMFFKLYVLDGQSQKLSAKSKIAYLLLRNETASSILKIRLKVKNGMAYGSIFLPDTLSTGSYEIVSYTNWMKNFGEKSFFKKEIIIANRFDKEINIHTNKNITTDSISGSSNTKPSELRLFTDKTTYRQGEKVSITLGNNLPGTQQHAFLSVSVYEETPGISTDYTISNYLFLNKSNNIDHQKPLSYTYLPEIKGEILKGKVIDTKTQKRVTEACVLLSSPDTIINLQYAYTNNKGIFQFLLNDYYNGKELIFSIKDVSANKNFKIEIEDEFSLNTSFKGGRFSENADLKNYILKSQDIVYIDKTYQVKNVEEENVPLINNPICPKLNYNPIKSVYPADFVSLPDFTEIAREILPTVKVRKRKDIYVADIIDTENHLFFNKNPALFLDGVLIDNINQIISFGSDKIEKIDVISTERIFGDLKFPGIIAVFSKNKEIKNINPNQTSIRVMNDSYHPYSIFSENNKINTEPGLLPDFRQLLYWNPNFVITSLQNSGFEFYTSDHIGNYIIKVEGITSEGIPVSASTKIQILNNENLSQR